MLGPAITPGNTRLQYAATAAAVKLTARAVVYLNSTWDGDSETPGANSFAAVATDKTALLPGETATIANCTNYDKGLNCVMVAGVHDLDADAVEIAIGPQNDASAPPEFSSGPTPTVTEVDGRWYITFDSPPKNRWARITIKAGSTTGLAADDVFYFASLVGEVAPGGTINFFDTGNVNNNKGMSPVLITTPYDVDRDGDVDDDDVAIVQANTGAQINLFTAPV